MESKSESEEKADVENKKAEDEKVDAEEKRDNIPAYNLSINTEMSTFRNAVASAKKIQNRKKNASSDLSRAILRSTASV